jgi:hypothetical protein
MWSGKCVRRGREENVEAEHNECVFEAWTSLRGQPGKNNRHFFPETAFREILDSSKRDVVLRFHLTFLAPLFSPTFHKRFS